MSTSRTVLRVAAGCSFLIAAFHLVIIPVGAPAYRYFGAPEEMALLDETGSWRPGAIMLFLSGIFVFFGLLALAGSVYVSLPFRAVVRPGLTLVSGLYLLRGLALVPEAYLLLSGSTRVAPRALVFSLVSLLVGSVHAWGTYRRWAHLGQ